MSIDAIAVLLQLLALLNVLSTSILVIAALRHRWPALEERATQAVVLAVGAVAAAGLGLIQLRILDLPREAVLVLLVLICVSVSVPSLVWLIAFLAGRFEESDAVTAARAEDAAEGPHDGRSDHS